MGTSSCHSVIIIGAGISAAKVLAENGVTDIVILEASDRIGGRIRKEEFGDIAIEIGAGWVAGVGGKTSNPVWELANQSSLRTCFSDYSNARYNIYDQSSEVEPISTYVEYGDEEFLVADERGYEFLVYKMAESFLSTCQGKIDDNRLQLNK
ncbi:hypothetical protein MKW92_038969, partial [Papaver armeniacum]